MRRFLRGRWGAPLILAGLIVVIAALNLAWVVIEQRPPHWDMGRHLWTSLQYWSLAHHGVSSVFWGYFYYPPLIYLNSVPFYALFGVSVPSAVAANEVFLAIGMVSVYGIGKSVAGRAVGLLSALVFATSPLIATQFKEFQIDGPLAAMTALAMWALVSSPDLKSRWKAVGAGAAIGAAMLCKWTFFGVIAAPLAYCIALAIVRSYRERDWRRLINAGLALAVAGALILPWYYLHRHQLLLEIQENNTAAAAQVKGAPVGLSLASIMYYAVNVLNVQLYLIPTLFLVMGLWRAWKRRDHKLGVLVALIVGTYAFFTIVTNKDARYTLPFLSALAVIAVSWTAYLSPTRRKWAQLGLAAYCALTYVAISFGVPVLPKSLILYADSSPLVLWAQHGYIIGQPTRENWHLEEAVAEAQGSVLGYQGADTIWFNGWAMNYFEAKYGVRMVAPTERPQYLLVRSMQRRPENGYTVIKSWQLPDEMNLTEYKRD